MLFIKIVIINELSAKIRIEIIQHVNFLLDLSWQI